MKTIVGLFDGPDQARSALSEIARLGFRPERVGLLSRAGSSSTALGNGGLSTLNLPELGPVVANRPMLDLLKDSSARGNGGIMGAFQRMGLSKEEAARCIETIKRGGTLEAVTVSDDKEAEVNTIMRRSSASEPRSDAAGEVVIPLVEEELSIGKREIDAGGVRVSTHVGTRPVDKTVTLVEEHVRVERRVVDRPIDSQEEAFRDRSIAMKAAAEEPIVAKRAHVVEEIHIRKDRTERTETVHDTLRHTEVDISEIPAEAGGNVSRYREHFSSTYGKLGGNFESFAPAYEFGERLGERAPGRDWATVEPTAKSMWTERQGSAGGAWERFRDAIKFAWERAQRG